MTPSESCPPSSASAPQDDINATERLKGYIMETKRYWIAINGASCALTSMPFEEPVTVPVARQLIGFPTLEEAQEAQRVCLQAPMKEVDRFWERLRPDVHAGRVRVINPAQPEPPTHGATQWMEGSQADAIREHLREGTAKVLIVTDCPQAYNPDSN
jgi:hypothetical protein